MKKAFADCMFTMFVHGVAMNRTLIFHLRDQAHDLRAAIRVDGILLFGLNGVAMKWPNQALP